MASTPALAKPRARKPVPAVAQRSPDLDALDGVLSEMAAQTRPRISRISSRRASLQVSLRQREGELEMLDAEWSLIRAHFEAAEAAYQGERADIAGDIQMIRNALLDGAEQPERTAA